MALLAPAFAGRAMGFATGAPRRSAAVLLAKSPYPSDIGRMTPLGSWYTVDNPVARTGRIYAYDE